MNSSTENLIEYVARVNNALEKKEAFSTYNRDIMHATEIVAGGFKYATQEINLLSHELDQRLYGSPYIIELVEDFLDQKNRKLHILVETDIDLDHPMMHVCKKFPNKTVIKRVPDEWQKLYAYNFMTIDDFGYRFEADRNKFAAIVSFNEDDQKETRENMKNCFQVLDEGSKEIKVR